MNQQPTTLELLSLMLVKIDGKLDRVDDRLQGLEAQYADIATSVDSRAQLGSRPHQQLRYETRFSLPISDVLNCYQQ